MFQLDALVLLRAMTRATSRNACMSPLSSVNSYCPFLLCCCIILFESATDYDLFTQSKVIRKRNLTSISHYF